MAYADYLHCPICDIKTVYDANIEYENMRVGEIAAICKDCRAKGYRLRVINMKTTKEVPCDYWEFEDGIFALVPKEDNQITGG